MILKLGMKHRALELYKVCINHDPGMTLTFLATKYLLFAYYNRLFSKIVDFEQKIVSTGTSFCEGLKKHKTV